MNYQDTKNTYDELLYIFSVLKRLGCGDVDNFEQRIKSQKIQYFAQLFGVAPRYNYNLYLRGPYSPELANHLYQIKKADMTPILAKFIPKELESKFNDLKNYIKGMNARQLEITATYHWLIKVASMPASTAKKKLGELKSVSQSELYYVEKKYNQYEKIKKSYN